MRLRFLGVLCLDRVVGDKHLDQANTLSRIPVDLFSDAEASFTPK